jgi:hypothetical protein
MRTTIAFFALISTLVPALAEDLDQRRTLLVEHEWVTRVAFEPFTPHAKNANKANGSGAIHFAGGVDSGSVLVRRHVKKNGEKIRYRVKPRKGSNAKVRGTFRTSGESEELQALNLRVRGKAPRAKVKGTAGAEFVMHDAGLVVPSIRDAFVEVIHDESHPEVTALARLRVAPDGEFVAVGHIGILGERERTATLRATRWTLRPGPFVDEEYLGPDEGVALDLGSRAELVVGRMDSPGTTSSDALWIENGNGFHVTDFGDPASGPVFEATHVAGEVSVEGDTELIAVLRVVTGGVGAVRWSSIGGQTTLERPRETVGHNVRAMNDAGSVLGGDAYREGRAIVSIPVLWDSAGDATILPLGRDAAGRVSALSPDGTLAAGLFLDFFTDREPTDRHVIWDATDEEPIPVTMRTAFGVRGDGAIGAGPTAVTRSGTVTGWDAEGAFLWRADWPSAIPLRAYLEAAGLSIPEGVDRLEDAVDVVGGTVLAGTTRSGSGDRLANRHWIAFVPDTIILPAPR